MGHTSNLPFACAVFSLGTHIITKGTHGGHVCRGHNRAKEVMCASILKAILTLLYCMHSVLDWVSIALRKHFDKKQLGEKGV